MPDYEFVIISHLKMVNAYDTNHPGKAQDRREIFNQLFREYYKRLCFYAFRMVNDRQVAEDLVQDCFVKIWERMDRLDLTQPMASYLYTTVRHAAQHHGKKNNDTTSLDENSAGGVEPNIIHSVIETETLNEIHTAMETLPPKCQEIFKLLYIQGKSYNEVSMLLNVTESTIRTQKAKGMKLIREKLYRFLTMLT